MRIAVYGASGFTGGLTVTELSRRGLTPVLVGRNEDRLRKAAVGVADAEIRVAPLAEPSTVAEAFRDCDALINCAGPFSRWGEPVVRAAIAARSHYLDTTGEQHYLKGILDTFGTEAARAGVTVVPGMADDGGPGDLIANLTASRLDTVAELVIADLRVPGAVSRGTARSMVAVGDRGPVEYADGTWRAAEDGESSLVVPGEPGEVPVTPFALPGVATIPAHVRARRVRSVVRSDVAGLFAGLTEDFVDAVPEVPDETARAEARWLMLAEAVAEDGSRARGWVTGVDAYRLTAVIAVEGARRLVAEGAPAGTLAPAQAFDPAGFLDELTPHGVSWQVEGP
jgi:short subunit dehydrogenase-like uncharacterized protein